MTFVGSLFSFSRLSVEVQKADGGSNTAFFPLFNTLETAACYSADERL